MRVNTLLRDKYIRIERADKGRNSVFQDLRIRLIMRAGREGQIDSVAEASLFTHLRRLSRTGEKGAPRLMDGDCQHTIASVEGVLHPVSMVRVNIDIGDTLSAEP